MKIKKILLFVAVLILALPRYFRLPVDPDLWWHLKFGIDHLTTGILPSTDPYAYTSLQRPWVNHEWLTELLMAKSYLAGGGEGLFWFRAAILTLVLLFLFLNFTARGFHPLLLLLTFAMVLPYLRIYIIARPHSMSYLLVLVGLLVVETARRRHRLLWLLPALVALWVNLHGGFVLGLVLSFFAAAEFFATTRQKGFLFLPLASLAATLLCPFGFGILKFVWGELSVDHGLIAEWQPFLNQPLWHRALAHYLIFALPALAALAMTGFRQRFTETALFFFSAMLALLHARFFVLLVLTSSLTFYAAASTLMKNQPAKSFARNAFILALTLLLPWSVWSAAEEYRRGAFKLRVSGRDYPALAMDYLQQHPLGPNLCLAFQWGGYGIFRLAPSYKVSVDGRNTSVYAPDYIPKLLVAYKSGDLKGFLGREKADVLLVENGSPIDKAAGLDKKWSEVYRDAVAVIYIPVEKTVTAPAAVAAGLPAGTSGSDPVR